MSTWQRKSWAPPPAKSWTTTSREWNPTEELHKLPVVHVVNSCIEHRQSHATNLRQPVMLRSGQRPPSITSSMKPTTRKEFWLAKTKKVTLYEHSVKCGRWQSEPLAACCAARLVRGVEHLNLNPGEQFWTPAPKHADKGKTPRKTRWKLPTPSH